MFKPVELHMASTGLEAFLCVPLWRHNKADSVTPLLIALEFGPC